MPNIAVRKAKDLRASACQAIQNLLGRRLRDEEEVTVMVFAPHPAPPPSMRRAALNGMRQVLDKAAAHLKDVPAAEFDAAVNEAMEHVRRWK